MSEEREAAELTPAGFRNAGTDCSFLVDADLANHRRRVGLGRDSLTSSGYRLMGLQSGIPRSFLSDLGAEIGLRSGRLGFAEAHAVNL